MEHKKTLYSNILYLLLLQGANFLLPLINMPYLVQVLGEEKYGLIMFAQSFVFYFLILTDFGFGLYATKEVARMQDDDKALSYFFSIVMLIKLVLLALSFIIAFTVIFSVEKFTQDTFIYISSFGMLIGNIFFPVWFFLGVEKMKYITFLNLLIKAVFTLSIFLIIKKEADYVLVPILHSLGFLISAIVSIFIIRKYFNISIVKPKVEDVMKHFKNSAYYFLSRASVSLYTTSNVFIIGLVSTNVMVSYYSIAEKLFKAMQSMYSPIVNALMPNMAKNKDIKLFKNLLLGISVLNVIGCFILYFFAPEIIGFIFDEFTPESFKVFRILLVASVIVVPTVLIGYPLLGALNHESYANNSTIIGSVFHIVSLSILYFLNQIDIYNLAYLVIVTEMIVFSIRAYGVWKLKLLDT